MLAAAVALGASKTNEAGQPTQTFRKDIVQVGTWVHPGSGETIDISLARIQHWATVGNQMLAAGIKIPIPATHTNDPEKNRGYVQKFDVQGDKLWMNCELIGTDAIQLAARCEVSISVVPEVKGADGTVYTDAPNHIAMVTDPVIPGQGQFQVIELSRAKALQLAIGASPMELLKTLAATLGINIDGMADADATNAILNAVKTLKAGDANACDMATTKAALSKAEDQIKALELAAKKPEIDADTRGILIENVGLKLSKLVDAGQITPAVRTKIETNFNLKGDKAAAVTLSKTAGIAAGLTDAALPLLLDALAEMPVAETKGKTIKLAREGGEDKLKANIEATRNAGKGRQFSKSTK